MKILGINGLNHDAAVALIEDGEVLFAGHSERYTGNKNDSDLNDELIADCLRYGKPDKIAYFEISNNTIDLEKIELELIDFGLLEIISKKKYSTIIGSYENFNSLQLELEKREVEIINSGFDKIPNNLISIDEEKKNLIIKLINIIENDEYVQNVYHNLNI